MKNKSDEIRKKVSAAIKALWQDCDFCKYNLRGFCVKKNKKIESGKDDEGCPYFK